MSSRLDVCFVWHFHQPLYIDLATQRSVLPWVRLHSARNYSMMLSLLKVQPQAHVTINVTPVLAYQINAYASSQCSDDWLQLATTEAASLSPDQKQDLVHHFFDVNPDRVIDQDPLYHVLASRRDEPAATWSDQDILDLQCLFTRSWTYSGKPGAGMGQAHPEHYTQQDRQALALAQADRVQRFLPDLVQLAQTGQVEVATSPFAHPILPLLIDTDAAAAVQKTPLPRPAFRRPEDSLRQLETGKTFMERLLGVPITGCWPSEGSVSMEALDQIVRSGFAWTATDETILLRELQGAPRSRLYKPYVAKTASGNLSMLFRDRGLSDAIGFQYASMKEEDSVAQFIGHVRAIRDGLSEPGVLSIIMDGENAWEFYPGGGASFLSLMYDALVNEPGIRLATVSEALGDVPALPLPAIRPGSWIDGDFKVWIGDREDNSSWGYLRATRDDWEGFTPDEQERSYMSLMAAEGSDWNWWYGRDRTPEVAAQFDDLYRRHLINVYAQAGKTVPDLLLQPVAGNSPSAITLDPVGIMEPPVDGSPARYLDWAPSSKVPAVNGGGAMTFGIPVVSSVHIGCGRTTLYVLVEFGDSASSAEDLRVEIRVQTAARSTHFVVRKDHDQASAWSEPETSFTWGLRDTLQVGLPFDAMGAQPGEQVKLAILVLGGGRLLATIPSQGTLSVLLPGQDYDLRHWEV
jgi:alpha-amylase/alpha-mannosidase (GH57 family)